MTDINDNRNLACDIYRILQIQDNYFTPVGESLQKVHRLAKQWSFECARMTINKLPSDAAIQVLETWLRNNNG